MNDSIKQAEGGGEFRGFDADGVAVQSSGDGMEGLLNGGGSGAVASNSGSAQVDDDPFAGLF